MFGRNKKDTTSEWTQLEEHVSDEKSLDATRGAKSLTVLTGSGKKQRRVKLMIPRAFFPELKRMYQVGFWDAETMDAPSATASRFGFLANITVGGGATNRIGDSIYVENVIVRLHVEQSTSVTYTTANLAFVVDKEPAAGAPAWTDVFNGIGAASATCYDVAIPNYDKRARFVYAKRDTIPLAWSSSYYNAAAIVSVKPYTAVYDIPIKRVVEFDGSGSVYAGPELYLFGWSDVTSNTPKAYASYEIFFRDA